MNMYGQCHDATAKYLPAAIVHVCPLLQQPCCHLQVQPVTEVETTDAVLPGYD